MEVLTLLEKLCWKLGQINVYISGQLLLCSVPSSNYHKAGRILLRFYLPVSSSILVLVTTLAPSAITSIPALKPSLVNALATTLTWLQGMFITLLQIWRRLSSLGKMTCDSQQFSWNLICCFQSQRHYTTTWRKGTTDS